jgi:PGF-pre-PGF domain-containing protein
MHTKNKILPKVFLVILITSLCASGSTDNTDPNDGSLLLLKSGYINTDAIEKPAGQSDEQEPIAYTSQSIEDKEKYYIVQFTGPVQDRWKQEIKSAGASIYNYVPNNAFIFRMNENIRSRVDSLDFVKWTGEYEPSYKYEPEPTDYANIQLSGSGPETKNIYHVLLFSSADNEKVANAVRSMEGDVLSGSGNILKVQIPASRLPEIASINEVSWIEEYMQPVILNDVAADIITVNTTRNTYALKGSGQIVAVCDTGLDTGVSDSTMHADLRGRIISLIDLRNDGSAADQNGHGTHVAGSVLGNGALSGRLYSGMAPEAKLVFQAAGDSTGNLYLPTDMGNYLFKPAYDMGARIHTNSWGNSSVSGAYDVLSQQVDSFMWEHPDMLILFAAGNKGVDSDSTGVIDTDSIVSPGTAKNCLTVGASENYRPSLTSYTYGLNWPSRYPVNPVSSDYLANNPNGIAAFSSRGPTDDGRIKPDLIAPGTFIFSTRSSMSSGTGYYTYMNGTSMATPITAGAAALVRQYYVDIEGLQSPSAALIKATLINGAQDMTPGQYGTGATQEITDWPDHSQGWGRVDVENSIFPQNSVAVKYHDKVRLNDTGNSWNVTYDINYATEPLRITLVWTDYPGSASVVPQLVNDLDLVVTGPHGETYRGNGGDVPDNRNNVECVNIPTPDVGIYTVYVNATRIAMGPQESSLVLSFKEDNEITVQGIAEDEVVRREGIDINISSHRYSDIWYNIDNGENSPVVRAYSFDTTLNFTDGSHNLTVFAREITGQAISTTVNFTVFASQPAITSPASGTIYYLPDNSFSMSGNAAIATDISVYVNGNVTNGSCPVSNGAFDINDIPLLNGTNTVNVTSIFNYSGQEYSSPNTTIYLSVGETFNTARSDETTLLIPGIENASYPVLNFNITGTSVNPGNVSAAVIKGQEPGSRSTLTGPAIDIRVLNGSYADYSHQFGRNVSLTLGYDPALVDDTGKLTIAWYDPAEDMWMPFRSTVNSSAQTITTNITHLSIYAPLEDNTAPTISGLSNSRTATSITLTWENSPDTDHVELWKNGALLTTISDPMLTDSGLPAGTTHTYSLRAIDFVGNVGEWSNISITTSQIATTGSGGSGGGGGGSSGERADNILFKDVLSASAVKDTAIAFDFDSEMNDVQYIRFISLKNAGKITTTIEVLKNTSYLAASTAPGITYRNINIWVGKTGYATESNIMDPVIGFRVNRTWVLENSIDSYTISLNRYSGGSWEELTTEQTGSDEDYIYFEAKTPGFSPFAITGKQLALAMQGEETGIIPLELEDSTNTASWTQAGGNDKEGLDKSLFYGVFAGLSCLILTAAYFFRRRQQN